ncbi:MAG: hypothetical protein JJ975_00220 [Bacteroidia bacterium]|nr:hypothetical protein [Bacteroidia bacterium]
MKSINVNMNQVKPILIACLLILSIKGFGQTKKIANASHASHGPSFNWVSTDNLGFIMEYEDLPKQPINLPLDTSSIKLEDFDTMEIEQPTPVDTAVYEEVSRNSTLIIDEATSQEGSGKVKKSSSSKTPAKPKKKRKKKRRRVRYGSLKSEINDLDRPDYASHNEGQTAGIGWFSFILLIPIGFLMFKKS